MVEHGRVFRVRKIDVARRLPLVRDLRELDNKGEDLRASRRGVTHGQEASDAERVVTSRLAGARDIPVPSVRVVPTYEEDYEPAAVATLESLQDVPPAAPCEPAPMATLQSL